MTRVLGSTLVIYRSYGTATADGVLGLLATGGHDRRQEKSEQLPGDSDPALQASLGWLAHSYDLGKSPGYESESSGWAKGTHFYWLSGLAEGLHRAGVWQVVDENGSDHVWASEMVMLLTNLALRFGGRFINKSGLMHEDRPTLSTALALVALTAARDRLRLGGGGVLRAGERAPAPGEPVAHSAVERGRDLFQKRGCIGCHADGGQANGPSLVGVGQLYLGELNHSQAAIRIRRYLTDPQGTPPLVKRDAFPLPMPAFPVSDESEDELDDLVAFLLSRLGKRPVASGS